MEEPRICVGIMGGEMVDFVLKGRFVCGGMAVEGEERAEARNGKVWWNGRLMDEVVFVACDGDGRFELEGVTIGVDFHWERREKQRFAGALRLIVSEDDKGRLIAVNEIGIEEYLKSVISSEMSANASEALLMAHAVISRSWLLRQLADRGKHSGAMTGGKGCVVVDGEMVDELVRWYDREDHRQFDVCADDHCQRYQGVTRQTTEAVEKAVDATRGMVLTWNGEVCDARFSKCCGGVTELFENCWEETPHPYLERVEDCDGHGSDFCDTDDDEVLRQVLNDYDRETKDFYRWEVRYGADEFSELIRRRSGIDFGRVIEIEPLERGVSGRIVRLLIRGEKRQMVVGKELELRRWLSDSHLRSSAFDVVCEGGDFVLRGKGWGHGVGLCQIGAAVMGAKGYGYDEILKHYFPKAELKKLY